MQNNVEFVCAADSPGRFPKENLPEVALLGRSNVGKSSLLNCLAGGQKLAFTSSTPGRTQTINFYRVDGTLFLVDLPGYGYAKVPSAISQAWRQLAESYLFERESLRLSAVIVDSRRGLMESDSMLIAWLQHHGRPFVVVATKIDKLNQRERSRGLAAIRREITGSEVIPFSAVTGQGVKETWQAICKIQPTK